MPSELEELEAMVANDPDENLGYDENKYVAYSTFREKVMETYPLAARFPVTPSRDRLILTVDDDERFTVYPEDDPSHPVYSGRPSDQLAARIRRSGEHWDLVLDEKVLALVHHVSKLDYTTDTISVLFPVAPDSQFEPCLDGVVGDSNIKERSRFFCTLQDTLYSGSAQERYWVHRSYQSYVKLTLEYLRDQGNLVNAFYWAQSHPVFWVPDWETGVITHDSLWSAPTSWEHEVYSTKSGNKHQLYRYTPDGTRIVGEDASYDEAVIKFARKLHQTYRFDGTERKDK